jgi:hypothetical protein
LKFQVQANSFGNPVLNEGFFLADFLGYAIINVSDTGINTDIYTGDSDKVWKDVLLGSVLNN